MLSHAEVAKKAVEGAEAALGESLMLPGPGRNCPTRHAQLAARMAVIVCLADDYGWTMGMIAHAIGLRYEVVRSSLYAGRNSASRVYLRTLAGIRRHLAAHDVMSD